MFLDSKQVVDFGNSYLLLGEFKTYERYPENRILQHIQESEIPRLD